MRPNPEAIPTLPTSKYYIISEEQRLLVYAALCVAYEDNVPETDDHLEAIEGLFTLFGTSHLEPAEQSGD